MRKTNRPQLNRERLLYQYSLALEVGDFEAVASVLAVAENDPILERMILDINDALQGEVSQPSMNNNHKGQALMTLIQDSTPRVIPYKRQSRLSGVAALVAAMLIVVFAGYFLVYSNNNREPSSGAVQIRDTATPTLQPYEQTAMARVSAQTATSQYWIQRGVTVTLNHNQNTATAFWNQQTQTQNALNPNQRTATAFWNQQTQTVQVELGTHTPGPTLTATPLSTTDGFNSNEQTATAFWIKQTMTQEANNPPEQTASAIETQNSQYIATFNYQQTATAVATQFPPTVPPPAGGVQSDAPYEVLLQYPDFDRLFRGIDGTFVLYDPQNDVTVIYNPDRAQQRFAPHSTFKILNAAISLETGAMPDEDYIIEWDQEQYPLTEYPNTSPFNKWRQDQNLRSGMRYSVVWFYTEVARRIGEEQMADWVESVGYGNMDTSAWLDPVPFWLGGSLEITPLEQTQFLWRFYNGELGFSQRTTDIVKDLIVLEETDTYRLSGKTGTGEDGLAWLVGYLERGDDVYVFALNLNLEGTDRLLLTKQVFIEMGLIE